MFDFGIKSTACGIADWTRGWRLWLLFAPRFVCPVLIQRTDCAGSEQSLVRDIQPAVQAVKGKSGDAVHLAVTEDARLMAEHIGKEASLARRRKKSALCRQFTISTAAR